MSTSDRDLELIHTAELLANELLGSLTLADIHGELNDNREYTHEELSFIYRVISTEWFTLEADRELISRRTRRTMNRVFV